MTLEQIQRLGTPYYSTKEKGTGIGMLVVYNIINSMNGQIQIRSEKDKGTCFFITLPLVKNQSLETTRSHAFNPKEEPAVH